MRTAALALTLHGSADDRKVMLKHMWHAPTAGGGGGGGGGKRGKRGGAGGYLFHVVVTTYETLLLEASSLGSVRWNYAIVDEAQRLKNLESRARAAVEELRYEQVALLTGTPVQNCTAELFSLLNLLESLLDPAKGMDVAHPNLDRLINQYFVWSLVWSVGGNIDDKSRPLFH